MDVGILERLGLSSRHLEPPSAETLAGPIFENLATQVPGMSVEQLWEEQPHLRTVTDFIARSISSVSLHAYRRQPDGGRDRIREGWVADLCKKANATQLMSDVIHRAVMDLCLYDEWIWVLIEDPGSNPELLPVPPTWVRNTTWDDPWTMRSIIINDNWSGVALEIPADRVIRQTGYKPGTMKQGSSPITALKQTLQEQLESAAYRAQIWKNGPRVSGIIERPKETSWDDAARRRFKKSVQAWYSGRGSQSGGALLLEDGMTMKPFHLKADDEQVVEMTKLSKETVASAFHVNPTMIGALDNANYSNVREFRKSLYGDSLGPIIKRFEDVLNLFVLPALGSVDDLDGVYLEFNLDEKLRASFEEKAAVTSTAVGGPWMTANEARAMNNLPALDGADELIRPLNVGTVGDDPPGDGDDDDAAPGAPGEGAS